MSFARVSFFIGPELIARASTFSPKTCELIREISEKRRGVELERKKGDLRILIIMYLVYFFSRENDIYIYIALDFPVDEDKA